MNENIRIREEMEKAYKAIIDTIELGNNVLNLNAILYKDLMINDVICKYHFTLNGKEIKWEKL